MKRKMRHLGVLAVVAVAALIIMMLPGSEAGAETSASDFEIVGSTLVAYRGREKEVVVPDTVEVIGGSAFEGNGNVEIVVLPDSVVQISPYAFWDCRNLAAVALGKGLSEVGNYAFAGCTGLRQMSIPSNVSTIGIQAFGECVNLRDISIPKETTSIHETAFEGCILLTIHCDPGTPANVYAEAFYERQKNMEGYEERLKQELSSPTPIPAEPSPSPEPIEPTETPVPAESQGRLLGTTTIVGNHAVVFADSMRLPVYGNERQEPEAVDGTIGADILDGRIVKYTIIDGQVVADQAYYRSQELENVVLPAGIREIGEFSYARSSAASVVLPEGVERIGYGAFYHCDLLQEAVLPDTVRCVEPKAFFSTPWVQDFLDGASVATEGDFLVSGGVLVAYRGNAAEVAVPEGIRVIAGEAFLDHGEIEAVTLPDSLVVVGEGAFEGCNGLKQISFGRNVEEIKDRAFLGNAMSEVSVPSSVKKIGLQAFGTAIIAYEEREAEYTYEPSATRLANAAYRGNANVDGLLPGVTVTGLETLFGSEVGEQFKDGLTSLSGADGSYTLNVSLCSDITQMESAFRRTFQTGIPNGMQIYDLELTDGSGIPLRKLGKETLSVVLPVPEVLKGQELSLFTLDANGQLERLIAEPVDVDGVEAFRFETNHPTVIGISTSL